MSDDDVETKMKRRSALSLSFLVCVVTTNEMARSRIGFFVV